MSQVNTHRAPQPAPRSATDHLGAAVLASVPPINNKSNSNSGDPLGNATSSLLVYMFEVLPGRMTGRLVPEASGAQSWTPQLMASAHAQAAVAAHQTSWDSGFWVRAGDALSMGFDGVGGLVSFLGQHARLPHLGPTGAGAAAAPSRPAQSLLALEASLSDDFTIEKSEALLRYQAEGGDDADDLVILIPDPDHGDEDVQKRLMAAIHRLMQIDRGDRLMKEFAGLASTSKERIADVCGVLAKACDIFVEPPTTADVLKMAAETVQAAVVLLDWYVPHLPNTDAETLITAFAKIDLQKTTAVSYLIREINTYTEKVDHRVAPERMVRWKAFSEVNERYQSSILRTRASRSAVYLQQGDEERAKMPKQAKLLLVFGSQHANDCRDRILKDTTKKYLIGNLKPSKIEL